MDNDIFDECWNLLKEKGLTRAEIFKVRNVFSEWGLSFPQNVKRSGENHYTSTVPELSGYGFGKEKEVELYNALHKYSPETKKEKLVLVMEILNKLFNIESEWKFEHDK